MKLIVLGLPLGNIEDISLRAISVLSQAQQIICEDTRVFNKLWQKLSNMGYLPSACQAKLHILNEFNEARSVDPLFLKLDFHDVILVSDAGLPSVSDPGFRFINKVLTEGGEVTVIPGPTAAMTALAGSGFSSDLVIFYGFLPKKESKIKDKLSILSNYINHGITAVFYESPYRVIKLLTRVNEMFNDPDIVVANELTKMNEKYMRGKTSEILERFQKTKPRGEYVVLIRLEKKKKLD